MTADKDVVRYVPKTFPLRGRSHVRTDVRWIWGRWQWDFAILIEPEGQKTRFKENKAFSILQSFSHRRYAINEINLYAK